MSSIPFDTSSSLSLLRSSFSNPNASNPTSPTSPSSKEPLNAFQDARQIVRLIQCSICSLPLRKPFTLPCANTLCKTCIPELHLRPNVSFPATANRLQAFTCPFTDCEKEHAIGDCSLDVQLNKIMEIVRDGIAVYKKSAQASKGSFQLEVKDKWSITGVPSLQDDEGRIQIFPGGRLTATYMMVEMGDLAYDSEVVYTEVPPTNEKSEYEGAVVLEQLKEAMRPELNCQVCYEIFLDPLTTTCGHTLCRKCLHRIQDHANDCPVCRRILNLPPGVKQSEAPSNIRASKLISSLWPEDLAARQIAANLEDAGGVGELDTPLFVCTLSFPSTPTFLHVFEPRYKLMIRRAVDTGDRKFGMVLHNPNREPQGELGQVPFYQYGTMLHIVNMHIMPDGRSIIETTGVSRFRVVKYGTLDGYTVGKVERVDDMTIQEEEAIEAAETTAAITTQNFDSQDQLLTPPSSQPESTTPLSVQDINSLSTRELRNIGTSFVRKMKETAAPWLHRNVVHAYGECPNDPVLFAWWFASVIPTSEAEKYRMLQTTSVRQRLKMCVAFAAELERQKCSQSTGCNVL